MLAAYEANKPVVVNDALPTAASPTAQCERAYVIYHMRTCLKCRLHSAASLVTCVSYKGSETEMDEGLERLRRWKSMPSPECYMRYMHHSVRTGFEPSFDTEPAAIRMRNHKPTYDDYPTTVTHLDQIEPMGVLSGGCATPGPGSAYGIVVNPLLTVVRDKHRRKAKKDGSIPKGRVAMDSTAPLVNESMTRWPFRYDDVDAAARLISPGCWMGKIDLTKYFLQFASGKNLQRFLWFSDPRHEPEWYGAGPEPPGWRDGRDPSKRYRKYLGCPFGIRTMPAFASFVSGEICRMLRSFGLDRVVYYIDDLLVVADTEAECQRQMDLAMVLLRKLGLTPAESKTEGPAQTMDFLGVDFADGDRLEISTDRLRVVSDEMDGMIAAGTADRDSVLSLAGKLSWFSLVLPGTRTFLRRIWDFIVDAPEHGATPLSAGAIADMEWWCTRIERGELRGSRLIPGDDVTEAAIAHDLSAADAAHARYRTAKGETPASEAAGPVYAVDLCCGAGGFSLGARMADIFVLLGVDGCKAAIDTYRAGMAAAEAEDALLPGAENNPRPQHASIVHDVTDWRRILEIIEKLPHKPRLLLASPPCQPFSTSGRGLAGDPRADVVASVVELAMAMQVDTLLIENVPGFINSPQFAAMCSRMEKEYTIEWGVADAKYTAVPQARRRVFVTARRSKTRCGMRDAAAALPSRGVCTLADALPDVSFAYHIARTSRGRCVVPATEPMQTLRTNCINGVNRDKYRPRSADAAPISECTVLGAARLGVVQGFPADYPWPERRMRCKCKYCVSSSVSAVSKQIGNAVPPRLAEWAIRTALWRSEAPPAQTGQPVAERPPLGAGLPRLITVKSDAAGDGRWCYVYDHGDGAQRQASTVHRIAAPARSRPDAAADASPAALAALAAMAAARDARAAVRRCRAGHPVARGAVAGGSGGETDGIIVWGRLDGADRQVHVPYFELAAVYECVMRHGSDWVGAMVRFGVDSSPVVNALNTATSRDPHLLRLLRAISDASINFGFDVVAVHVTRAHNLLADQGTRHATPQDLRPYLAPEGFSAEACEATASSFPPASQLSNGPISWLRLGPRARSRSRRARCGS